MPLNIFLFAVGLVMLIKGGDWFVDSASGIARKFHLPELLIGATVVSIGTTLPEVMVSAQGALGGSGDIAYGNAIGSIICNTALIAAITVAIKPGRAKRKDMILPVGFFFFAAAIYVIMAYSARRFDRWVGIVLLSLFVIYMVTTVLMMKKKRGEESSVGEIAESVEEGSDSNACDVGFSIKRFITELVVVLAGGAFMMFASENDVIKIIGGVGAAVFVIYEVYALIMHLIKRPALSMLRDVFFLVIGSAIIAGGANLLVDNGIKIAEAIGVPESVIALTFVALGTSLPELCTAITSLVKGHGALSLGNVIGANLFNLVLVSGVATTLSPFEVPTEQTIQNMPMSLVLDIPIMLGVMALLVVPTMFRQKLSRIQGIVLLCIYVAFCTLQFVL